MIYFECNLVEMGGGILWFPASASCQTIRNVSNWAIVKLSINFMLLLLIFFFLEFSSLIWMFFH